MEKEMNFRAGVLCGCISTVLYGVNCTLFCALTYTCTHCGWKDPFLCALCSLPVSLYQQLSLVLFPGALSWEAVPSLQESPHELKWSWCLQCCSPLYCPVGRRSISVGAMQWQYRSPDCCLWYCFYSLFKGFALVRHMEGEGGPTVQMTTSAEHAHPPVQHSSSSHQPRQMLLMFGF